MWRVAFAALAVLLASGCLGLGGTTVRPETGVEALIEVPVNVHVVTVGLAPGLIDEAALFADLPTERQPFVTSVSRSSGTPTYQNIVYRMSYTLHEAPEAFARGLYDAALDTAERGRPNAWLAEYDVTSGQERLCSPCLDPPLATATTPEDVLYLDAMATEAWIADNLAAHGLDFGPTALTLLLLDGEGFGTFPTDTYHYWRYDDGHAHSDIPTVGLAPTVFPPGPTDDGHEIEPFHTPKDPIAMRAWGGRWNFAFLDLTAAPSAYDIQPHRPYDDWQDPPLWDVDAATLNQNLAINLADLVQLRVARDPLYPVEPYTRFLSPIHVFIEEGAMENPQTGLGVDLETWVPEADVQRAIARIMPWATVETPVVFHFLPDDDPGMAQVLKRARVYNDPTLVSPGIVKSYVREHWAEYVPEPGPDEFVMPQFYFFFNGFYTFWGVSSAGGWADGDAEGRPWAIFNHFFDLCVRTTTIPCTKATTGLANLTILPVHEAGHELSLMHTKDGSDIDEDGWPESMISWLWDSMFSTMSYRHVNMQYDHWDIRNYAINHVERMLTLAAQMGGGEAHDAQARVALAEGRWTDAVAHARMAYDEARVQGTLAEVPVQEELLQFDVTVPASRSIIGSPTLGITTVDNPLELEQEGFTYASLTFDVPADATHIRVRYEESTPMDIGVYRQSRVVVYGPDGSFRGDLGDSHQDEVVLTSHWRGAGMHELRVYQRAGTPGLYHVEVGIGGQSAGTP